MARKLILPDGIRLARKYELPGTEQDRSAAWERVRSASLTQGFTITETNDPRFSYYAEANIDAPQLWEVFSDLCTGLLVKDATLVCGEIDDDPVSLGSCTTIDMLAVLEPHRYQLSHDGYLQFGLIDERPERISEVFVAPTKHLAIWFDDVDRFRSIMPKFEINEADELSFLDEYPRTTKPLSKRSGIFDNLDLLVEHFEKEIAKRSLITKTEK